MRPYVLPKFALPAAAFAMLLATAVPAQASWIKLECKGVGGLAHTYALNRSRAEVRVDGADAVNVEYSENFVVFDMPYPNGQVYAHALNLEDLTLRIMEKTVGVALPLQKCSPLGNGRTRPLGEDGAP